MNTVVIGGVQYKIATDERGNLQWQMGRGASSQAGEPNQLVEARWTQGWQGGGGEVTRVSEDSTGHAFTIGMDAAKYGKLRLSPRTVTSSAPTNALGDNATYWLEETSADGTKWVLCCSGRYIYKLKFASNAITIENEKDGGANAVCGPPVRFESEWIIPLGASVDHLVLQTVANSGADTYATAANSPRSLAAEVFNDGTTAKAIKGFSTNQVNVCAANPEDNNNWSPTTGFEVGDSSAAITKLAKAGSLLYVAKRDDLYLFDGRTGTAYPIFAQGNLKTDSVNGVGLTPVGETQAVLYNHLTGLHLAIGTSLRLNVGPDGIPSNDAIENVTLEPVNGRHYEAAITNNWIYTLYRVTEGGSTRTYICAGRMVGGPTNIIWYYPFAISSAARGCFVDSEHRLWTQNGTAFEVRLLGKDGSPDPGRGGNGRGAASTTYRTYLPETDFGYPTVEKQGADMEVLTRGLDATTRVILEFHRDGGTAEQLSNEVTSDGVHLRYWQPGADDSFQRLRPVLRLDTTSSFDNTSATVDPQILGLVVRARLKPIINREIALVVDTGEDPTNIDTALELRRKLLALEDGRVSVAVSGGPTEIPEDAPLWANVSVGDVQVRANGDGYSYHVAISLTERLT